MKDKEFRENMAKIREAIKTLSPDKQKTLLDLVRETESRFIEIKRAGQRTAEAITDFKAKLADINSGLQTMVVHLKYMLFDFEATQREKAEEDKKGPSQFGSGL